MEEICIVVPGTPVGKGRARSNILMRGGKPVIGAGGRPIMTHHTPEKTANYENLVKLAGQKAMEGRQMFLEAVDVVINIHVTPPESWSQKKKRAALDDLIRPTSRPDLDNIAKGVSDALNEVVWKDDKQITDLVIRKRYAEIPQAVIYVRPAVGGLF